MDDRRVYVPVLKRPKAPGERNLDGLVTEEELVDGEILLPVATDPPHHHARDNRAPAIWVHLPRGQGKNI